MAAMPGAGLDALFGIGGAPEAVVAACALKCIGGNMQCTLWPRNDDERRIAREQQIDLDRVLSIDDLMSDDNIFVAATGITDGEMLRGVHYVADGATTQSVVMHSHSGTVRSIEAMHRLSKLRRYGAVAFQ